MTDAELMQQIKAKYGGQIAASTAASSLNPALVAALIANESDGNPDAKRHEAHVLAALWEVLLGRAAKYGAISGAALVAFIAAGAAGAGMAQIQTPASLPADAFQRLDALGTSWGLTQIMGYQVFDFYPTADAQAGGLSLLRSSVPTQLYFTVRMLARFAGRWDLSIADDAKELLTCWNTGRPAAATADPQYVPNGLARMKLYEAL